MLWHTCRATELVIAGEDLHGDAVSLEFGEDFHDVRQDRVGEADEAGQHGIDLVVSSVGLSGWQPAVRHRQHAQTLRAQAFMGVAGPERAEGYAPAAAPPADLLAAAFELALLPALDGGAEGQAFAYAGKAGERGRIELGGRFTTGFGAECREFTRSESRDGVASRAGGVACRGADRSWNVLLLPVAGS